MKVRNSVFWLLWLSVIVALPSSSAFAEDEPPIVPAGAQTETNPTTVNLTSPEWQTVLDRLFGIPDSGLIDGTGPFHFRAEEIILTAAQAELFTAIDSPQSLAALIEAAEALRGNIRLEGTIDGQPFELKLAGRELKIQGLTLTEAQRQALVGELSAIDGLKEMKIQALVDGKMTVTKFQGGHEKLEIRDGGRPEHPQKLERAQIERPAKIERVERPERFEKPERPERGLGRR